MNRTNNQSKLNQTDRLNSSPQTAVLKADTQFDGLIINRITTAILAALALSLSLSPRAIAQVQTDSFGAQTSEVVPARTVSEGSSSVAEAYQSATVYLPDPQTQQLEPQNVLVAADQPVEGAIDQIIESYEGQRIGITGYEIDVDSDQHEAEVNFNINHPRGAEAFQSLSSANQYALIEAIRETLLTQPGLEIDRVIFSANGDTIDI